MCSDASFDVNHYIPEDKKTARDGVLKRFNA